MHVVLFQKTFFQNIQQVGPLFAEQPFKGSVFPVVPLLKGPSAQPALGLGLYLRASREGRRGLKVLDSRV